MDAVIHGEYFPITFWSNRSAATCASIRSTRSDLMSSMRRAIACFDQALVDVGLADDDRLRGVLHDYFEWATTTTMSRYHRSADEVPDGLRIPHWSWDGLAGE